MLRYEHHRQPLLPPSAFLQRLLRHGLLAFSLIGLTLAIGMAGYHYLVPLPWVDAFLNASMLLGGMGPVRSMDGDAVTASAKLFAGFYALFCGLVLITITGLLLAPTLHRVLHVLHLESPDDREDS